jgi:hypothetical protein
MGENPMTSILPQIYDLLDGMSVTYSNRSGASVTATCYDLDELPNSIETAHLPCRLLLPIGQGQSGSPNIVLDNTPMARAEWRVTDLFLLEAVARSEGLAIQAPVLMRYVTAYSDAIAKKWQMQYQWQTEALTLSIAIAPGIYNYPTGSDAYFFGVKADLRISEIF